VYLIDFTCASYNNLRENVVETIWLAEASYLVPSQPHSSANLWGSTRKIGQHTGFVSCQYWMQLFVHCAAVINDICDPRITNRQKLLTFYCLWAFNWTLQPGLIMPKASDDSLFSCGPPSRRIISILMRMGEENNQRSWGEHVRLK